MHILSIHLVIGLTSVLEHGRCLTKLHLGLLVPYQHFFIISWSIGHMSHSWVQGCIIYTYRVSSTTKLIMFLLLCLSWQLICKGFLKHCLRGMLETQQCSTVFKFLDALTLLLGEVHDSEKLPEVTQKVNMALALIKRDFPMAIQLFALITNSNNKLKYCCSPCLWSLTDCFPGM